jgi:Fic family protein
MYAPPFEITPKIINLISEISERIGAINIKKDLKIRKISKIKTLIGTLKIEGINADEEKVTAILEGKRVLATQKEISEIKGAVTIYENIDKFDYKDEKDLLKAHKILMQDILKDAGKYRTKNVGVGNDKEITHIAPPAQNISNLMKDLFQWLNNTQLHPLIVSSVFHYEFEFIHPFSDGNGRIGRFWQTLILYNWKSVFEYLPIESIIYENQTKYYLAIENSTTIGNSTPFIEFMLKIILDTLTTPQATPQVTPQDEKEIKILEFCKIPRSRKEISIYLGIKDRKYLKEILDKLIAKNLLQMTIPTKPTSPKQKYITKSAKSTFI